MNQIIDTTITQTPTVDQQFATYIESVNATDPTLITRLNELFYKCSLTKFITFENIEDLNNYFTTGSWFFICIACLSFAFTFRDFFINKERDTKWGVSTKLFFRYGKLYFLLCCIINVAIPFGFQVFCIQFNPFFASLLCIVGWIFWGGARFWRAFEMDGFDAPFNLVASIAAWASKIAERKNKIETYRKQYKKKVFESEITNFK